MLAYFFLGACKAPWKAAHLNAAFLFYSFFFIWKKYALIATKQLKSCTTLPMCASMGLAILMEVIRIAQTATATPATINVQNANMPLS